MVVPQGLETTPAGMVRVPWRSFYDECEVCARAAAAHRKEV